MTKTAFQRQQDQKCGPREEIQAMRKMKTSFMYSLKTGNIERQKGPFARLTRLDSRVYFSLMAGCHPSGFHPHRLDGNLHSINLQLFTKCSYYLLRECRRLESQPDLEQLKLV